MEKDLRIYQELSTAAATVFSEGIDAPAGIYNAAINFIDYAKKNEKPVKF